MGAARHQFVIIIPVADRPRQLRNCLQSLLHLCRTFPYAGQESDGRFRQIRVLVWDDSCQHDSVRAHRQIVADFDARGLSCEYFGQAGQQQVIARAQAGHAPPLEAYLGKLDAQHFCHKGASVTRNIAYLKLIALADSLEQPLFWFIDSDQWFAVNRVDQQGEEVLEGIDYFHAFEQIFSANEVQVLTGKVVGDPPVSPAVMAGHFIDDVSGFLQRMAGLEPTAACAFHGQPLRHASDAAYHDMAGLFGFANQQQHYPFNCPLVGPHDNAACFRHFAARLDRFFDGEHPTRRSYFQSEPAPTQLTAARTIYTGNYLLRPEALVYFIPFAALGLRMAGPVLGRLIRADLGAGFVSANLPMLHKRTLEETGQSECRPGVERSRVGIDLSGEFERQFFGDVLLFAMEDLIESGYPRSQSSAARIDRVLLRITGQMHGRYLQTQSKTLAGLQQLQAHCRQGQAWWQDEALVPARRDLEDFIANLAHNFGPQAQGFRLIGDGEHRAQRLAAMGDALRAYPHDRRAWQRMMAPA
jgi:hypothetical protein